MFAIRWRDWKKNNNEGKSVKFDSIITLQNFFIKIEFVDAT